MAFLLRMGHGDTVTAFQSPLLIDLPEHVMEGQGASTEFVLIPSGEDLVEGNQIVLRHRDKVRVNVRRALVQMYDKGQYVLLPVFSNKAKYVISFGKLEPVNSLSKNI